MEEYEEVLKKLVKQEYKTMEQLNHPHIVKMMEKGKKANFINHDGTKSKVYWISLELCLGGDFFDIVSESGAFSEDFARYYFQQMVSALEYMHDKGFSHRDMKLDNILLDSELNLKISDFGFASHQSVNTTYKGTENYMAPEILLGKEYNGKECDIFASGVILFTMITRSPPFIKANSSDKLYKFLWIGKPQFYWKRKFMKDKSKLKALSEDFKDLVSAMFSFK